MTGKKVTKTVVKTEWKLGEAQDKAYQALTRHLTEPPVLCYPDLSKRFLLRTDTSKQGLGVVLCQEQESVDIRVVAYGSRALHMAEENYSTHKLEFLALYWASLWITTLSRMYRPLPKWMLWDTDGWQASADTTLSSTTSMGSSTVMQILFQDVPLKFSVHQ